VCVIGKVGFISSARNSVYVSMKMIVFWDVAPCSLVEVYLYVVPRINFSFPHSYLRVFSNICAFHFTRSYYCSSPHLQWLVCLLGWKAILGCILCVLSVLGRSGAQW
jgi:hypothetical protein